VEWLNAQENEHLFLSVVTLGEIKRGLTLLSAGKRRIFLEGWYVDELLPWFEGRVFPVSAQVAEQWGKLDGLRQLEGNPLNTADGMIAATALQHGLSLVTRNSKDFVGLGVSLVNPWQPD
jgi:predicted nucleic acid-binding protein